MNVLLWRAEYGDASHGSRVSREVVIEKIFNAPDASSLQVFQNGKPLGFIRWEIIPDEIYFRGTNQPIGRVESIDGYTLAVDGRVDVEPLQSKVRFTLRTGLDSDLNWQNLHATLDTSKNVWEFQSIRTNQLLEVKYEGALGQWERSTSFEEMHNPAALVDQFAGPALGPFIKPMLPSLGQAQVALPLTWPSEGPNLCGTDHETNFCSPSIHARDCSWPSGRAGQTQAALGQELPDDQWGSSARR